MGLYQCLCFALTLLVVLGGDFTDSFIVMSSADNVGGGAASFAAAAAAASTPQEGEEGGAAKAFNSGEEGKQGVPLLPEADPNANIPSIKLGETISFEEMGPIILNKDGSTRRIDNWDQMTEGEKKATWRRISKRNEERRKILLQQQQEQAQAEAEPEQEASSSNKKEEL